MTTLGLLKDTREYLANPDHWAQGSGGINCDKDGALCMWLALRRVEIPRTKSQIVVEAMGFNSPEEVCDWNDVRGRTHAEVLAKFDEAIARLSGGAE